MKLTMEHKDKTEITKERLEKMATDFNEIKNNKSDKKDQEERD